MRGQASSRPKLPREQWVTPRSSPTTDNATLLSSTQTHRAVPLPRLGHVIPLCIFPSSFILLENATLFPHTYTERYNNNYVYIYPLISIFPLHYVVMNQSKLETMVNFFGGWRGWEGWGCKNRCYKSLTACGHGKASVKSGSTFSAAASYLPPVHAA